MAENPETPHTPGADEGQRPLTPRLAPGILLAANDVLQDPNFSNTIVLLCQHSEDGAYGLVLNRPSHMPLREIFEHPPALPDGRPMTRRVYIGGPVRPTELQILQLGEPVAPETMQIAPSVHMGGKWETLEEILAPDPASLRLFLGYAGWGEGQLEEEIEAGAWSVLEADICRLLMASEDDWSAGPEQLRRFIGGF
jgi:putative transcriptional regulator